MAKRKGLSKRTRFEVFKRDQFTCQYCGRTPPAVILHADHVIAVANGGNNSIHNLITSCADCNLGKSDRPLDATAPPLKDAMERARELSEQVDAYSAFLIEQRDRQSAIVERLGLFWFNQFVERSDQFVFGPGRKASAKTFLKHLTEAEILDAMEISARVPVRGESDERRWKYFCGVCWSKIKGQQ